MVHLLFVYGTLKKGLSNSFLLNGETFLCDAVTTAGFTLYSLGDYPGMIAGTAEERVKGELWNVSDECLQRLDVLEDVEDGLYRREFIFVQGELWDGEKRVYAYIYNRSVAYAEHIGDEWRE